MIKIDDFNGLAAYLQIESKQLGALIHSQDLFYKPFKIPKRSGGYRELLVPIETLKQVQRRINSEILSKFVTHINAHAYSKQRSIITNATRHLNAPYLFKVDIQDFFPSISSLDIYFAFEFLRLNYFSEINSAPITYTQEISRILSQICSYNNQLPQGAPSSPTLSNIVSYKMDVALTNHCSSNSLTYTRYSDDMVFSSASFVSRKERRSIMKIIEDHGYKINIEKISFITSNKEKFVTGLYLSDSGLRLPKSYRRDVRSSFHNFQKGVANSKFKPANFQKQRNKVLGQLQYWKMIEPQSEFPAKAINFIKTEIDGKPVNNKLKPTPKTTAKTYSNQIDLHEIKNQDDNKFVNNSKNSNNLASFLINPKVWRRSILGLTNTATNEVLDFNSKGENRCVIDGDYFILYGKNKVRTLLIKDVKFFND